MFRPTRVTIELKGDGVFELEHETTEPGDTLLVELGGAFVVTLVVYAGY